MKKILAVFGFISCFILLTEDAVSASGERKRPTAEMEIPQEKPEREKPAMEVEIPEEKPDLRKK